MHHLRLYLTVTCLTAALCACGFRGDLQPPPDVTPQDTQHKPIILDPLIGGSQ